MIRRRHYIQRRTPLKRSRRPIRRDARTAEEKRLDAEWRAEVVRKSHGLCVMKDRQNWEFESYPGPCGGRLDPHHVHGKSTKELRWSVGNGRVLCRRHHNWAHDHLSESRRLFDADRK